MTQRRSVPKPESKKLQTGPRWARPQILIRWRQPETVTKIEVEVMKVLTLVKRPENLQNRQSS